MNGLPERLSVEIIEILWTGKWIWC